MPQPEVDRERLRASMAQIYEIFKDIAQVADEVSTWRCPYKDRHDRCTAKFGCRNQLHTRVPGQLPVCTGDDNLDYRSAWET